ncbi:hypothetical protein ACFYPC_30100 [Streptomyces sp. NPDC005808]|uniref:hypothetical protein n=1 Tax=Streptomyces sp. NPDC005808 TaxID=3364734 RepID=UPI0036C8FD64
MLTALAATVAVGAVGVTALVVTRDHPTATVVQVKDSSGRVTAEVPGAWGRQLRDSGWNPKTLGLPAGTEPGLAVADDLAKWQDLRSGVNGAFIGLSEHGDVTAVVGAITHTGCHFDGSRTYTGARWHGLIRTWDDCPGGAGSLTEAGLTSADGDEQPQVYVQLRQDGGADATDTVLDSVRVEG